LKGKKKGWDAKKRGKNAGKSLKNPKQPKGREQKLTTGKGLKEGQHKKIGVKYRFEG